MREAIRAFVKGRKTTMSKRAEQRALEAYPNEHFVDYTYAEMCRGFYKEGYEQAEKDLALTWEDIWQIVHLYLEVNANHDYIPDKTPRLICEETLKRFKEAKK